MFLVLTLTPLLFSLSLNGWLAALSCDHHGLRGCLELSSSVEYLSVRLYNSSIVASGSRDSEWKNGVVGPKLLRKFWRTASILYESICWTACPNLLVKSRMDSSSWLKMVCRELMFPFCRTKHRYWETNAAHNSLNE